MKIIRLSDDHLILDAGDDVPQPRINEIGEALERWWTGHKPDDIPTTLVIGGQPEPIEYEDRRLPDIEGRLALLEARVDHLWQAKKR